MIVDLSHHANTQFRGPDRRDIGSAIPAFPHQHVIDTRFRPAFLNVILRRRIGLDPSHLFFDSAKGKKNHDNPVGSPAWDNLIHTLPLVSGDLEAIRYAIKRGLVQRLPEKIKAIEYGCGGKSGVSKPSEIIRAIRQSDRHEIISYTAMDIVPRYGIESSNFIKRKFNLTSYGVTGDFSASGDLNIPNEDSQFTPVVMSFGGPFANAPDESPANGLTSRQNAQTYFGRMNRQYGPGAFLLLSFQAQRDPNVILDQYKRTEQFEAFVFSAFTRAKKENVITDQDYNPYDHWEMDPRYDIGRKAVSLDVVCKNEHLFPSQTREKIIMQPGDRLPLLLSHKWDETDYVEMLEAAGYTVPAECIFREESSPHGLILAQSIRPLQLS